MQNTTQNSINTTIAILQDAIDDANFALENEAYENASNDTFYALTQMLRRLRYNNICIQTLVEDAMQDA